MSRSIGMCRWASRGGRMGPSVLSLKLETFLRRVALLLTYRNSRSPFDFAQGRLSTSLRFGRDDEFVSIILKTRHTKEDSKRTRGLSGAEKPGAGAGGRALRCGPLSVADEPVLAGAREEEVLGEVEFVPFIDLDGFGFDESPALQGVHGVAGER